MVPKATSKKRARQCSSLSCCSPTIWPARAVLMKTVVTADTHVAHA